MKSIVAVDEYWGIGKNNDLLFHLPEDMKYFKEKTLDKVVVMGSNTLKSFPEGKPLKRRTNIVLWPDGEKRDDCIVVGSLEELSAELKKYNTDDVFVIGGSMFYRTMLPYCDTAYVTKVQEDGDAVVFYENLDNLDNWVKVDESATIDNGAYKFTFCVYKNKAVKEF